MKLLFESWRGYLQEIGEASLEPYDFEVGLTSEDEVWYDFVSSDETMDYGSDYVLKFQKNTFFEKGEGWDISFEANESVHETGEGQPLKIMSTVVAIIKDFIDKPGLSRGIKQFVFAGIPKWGSQKAGKSQRTKLYLAYLKKNMPPGTQIEQPGSECNLF